MDSNFNPGRAVIPDGQQPTVPVSPLEKHQQCLEKSLKYFSSKMFLVQMILAIIFAVNEITFGRRYTNQCPVSPNIPIFLLVHGSTKVAWVGCSIIAYIEAKYFSNIPHIRILMLINIVLQLAFLVFDLIWFIIGNVWVWSVKSKVQTTDSSKTSTYCQNTLYSAAQGLIISTYIVTAIVVFLTIKRRTIGKKISSNQNIN